MALSRDDLADWFYEHFYDNTEPPGPVYDATRKLLLETVDAFALKFKLPLDASGLDIVRCKCGHPVGNHRNGTDGCREQAITPRGLEPCKCPKARPL